MVKSLDAVPWNERQWGHWLARNMINTKQKVGLGAKNKKVKKKNAPKSMARGASRSVTQTYQTQFSKEKSDSSSC